MLNKISQTNIVRSHLYVESEKEKPSWYREQTGDCQRQVVKVGVGGMGDGGDFSR